MRSNSTVLVTGGASFIGSHLVARAYGSRENETHAIIALIAEAFVKMDPYSIWGKGEQDRNFTYVQDVARARNSTATMRCQ